LLNCCSQHSLFIVEIGKVRISLYDVSNIHILLCSELINEGYRFHENVWFVSQPFFFARLRICVAKWILIVHNGFNCCSLLVDHNAWKLLCTELLVGRGWILEEVISDLCIEVLWTMRVIGFNS